MDITAVIPVRAGSTRIKNKNIRPFANSSLLEIKIAQLKQVEYIKTIVVSSDSDEMLKIANNNGVMAKKRPKEFCDEQTRTFNDVVQYIAEKQVESEIMMWVPCVCPMITEQKIAEGIELYMMQQEGKIGGSGVCTARLIKEYLYDEQGPVNFSVDKHVRSQDLPNWHYITNGFFIAKTQQMIDWRFVYGPNPFLFEVNKYEAIDIDDKYDFEIAEMIFNKHFRNKEGR